MENIENLLERIQLNKQQLAKALGVSVETVHLWKNQGMPYQKTGKRFLYSYHEVLHWAQGQKNIRCKIKK